MSDLDPTDGTVDAAIEAAADEAGVGREELLERAVVALAEDVGINVPDAEEVAAIESRLDAIDAEVDEKVGDLRDRFVELYRDLEAKAPADHAHPETAERLDELVDDLNELEARLDAIDAEGVDDKLSRVASAVVRIRRRLEAAERDRAERERLNTLTRAANRNGVRKANCTDCGETVDIGLLRTPECPHCGRAFADLDPNPGFLGTSRLVVEEQPALDGDIDEGTGRVSTRDAGDDR
ncbi:hypothetical protein [Halorubrum sp. Boch-26]|uniref:hypothetical protein n=1 Tax=Halorubrum sp. Boch-26 TaxID=2994426 RepID=UPI002468B1D9|nr:hypothetical protein [Halorubrum sp. Boch-26]